MDVCLKCPGLVVFCINKTFQVCGDECKYLTSLENISATKVPWKLTLHAGQKALV